MFYVGFGKRRRSHTLLKALFEQRALLLCLIKRPTTTRREREREREREEEEEEEEGREREYNNNGVDELRDHRRGHRRRRVSDALGRSNEHGDVAQKRENASTDDGRGGVEHRRGEKKRERRSDEETEEVKKPPEGGGGGGQTHAKKRRKNVRRKRHCEGGPKHVLEENIGEAFNLNRSNAPPKTTTTRERERGRETVLLCICEEARNR